MRDRRRTRRLVATGVASAVAHALVAAVLLRWLPVAAPTPPEPPESIELEVHDVATPEDVPPLPEDVASQEAPPQDVPPPPEAVASHEAPAEDVPPPPEDLARETPTEHIAPARPPRERAAPGTEAPPPPTAPTEGPSLLRMRPPEGAPRPLVGLGLGPETLRKLDAEGVFAPAAPAPAPRPSGFAERMAERQRHGAGVAIVQKGLAHPFLFDVGRDAEKGFAPKDRVLAGDPRDLGAAGTLKSWGRGLVEGYRRYLEGIWTGQRPPDLVPRGAPLQSPDPRDRPTDVLAGYNDLLAIAGAGARKIACEVCVVFEPGRPPRFELRRSSDNPELDRMAQEALAKAVARSPVPADLAATRACYVFDLAVARVPPVPVAGCGFDESSMRADCYWPLRKMLKSDVRLESAGPGG